MVGSAADGPDSVSYLAGPRNKKTLVRATRLPRAGRSQAQGEGRGRAAVADAHPPMVARHDDTGGLGLCRNSCTVRLHVSQQSYCHASVCLRLRHAQQQGCKESDLQQVWEILMSLPLCLLDVQSRCLPHMELQCPPLDGDQPAPLLYCVKVTKVLDCKPEHAW